MVNCFHKFLKYVGSEQELMKYLHYQRLLEGINLIILTNFIHTSGSHQPIANLLMGFKALFMFSRQFRDKSATSSFNNAHQEQYI